MSSGAQCISSPVLDTHTRRCTLDTDISLGVATAAADKRDADSWEAGARSQHAELH